MNLFQKTLATAAIGTTTTWAIAGTPASAFTLTNSPGDGTVTVGVDEFGSFGSSIGGTGTSDALYDAVGGPTSATTYESGVAIRFGNTGGRTFLTSGSIGGSPGGTVTQAATGTSTSATSAFSFGGLTFNLTQTLAPLFNAGVRTGSALTQTYNILNTSTDTLAFELLRYFDGDLYFDGSLTDGGGRLAGGTETLFETDSATGSSSSTTFVGINATGGTIPGVGRYEIDSFSDLRSRVIAGNALDGVITGDSADADEFIDAGNGYDVTLALLNLYSLGAGQSSTYTTQTIFGSGAPEAPLETVPNADVPEPTTIFGALVGGALLNRARRFRKRQ